MKEHSFILCGHSAGQGVLCDLFIGNEGANGINYIPCLLERVSGGLLDNHLY